MDTAWDPISLGCIIIVGVVAAGFVLYLLIQMLVEEITDWLQRRHRRRIARIEAELDAKSEQLRRTVLEIAQQLAAERDAAAQQMAHAAQLTARRSASPPRRGVPFGSAVANSTTQTSGHRSRAGDL